MKLNQYRNIIKAIAIFFNVSVIALSTYLLLQIKREPSPRIIFWTLVGCFSMAVIFFILTKLSETIKNKD